MLTAKLSELVKKTRGCNLKIQTRTSFEINGFKNGTAKHFENSFKSMHLFQRLTGGIVGRDCKKPKDPQQLGVYWETWLKLQCLNMFKLASCKVFEQKSNIWLSLWTGLATVAIIHLRYLRLVVLQLRKVGT